MSRRRLRVFSIVFGDTYTDWFERGCIRSLMWPRNATALREAEFWDIWTMPADKDRVVAAAERSEVPLRVRMLEPFEEHDGTARKERLKLSLTTEMRECRDTGAFLWIAPDSIFGDGTIPSILNIGVVPGICVATAPMRVLAPGFIEAMGDGPLSNAELVKLSFERMHRSFSEADASRATSNSYESGVSWRKIGDGLYAITHRKHSSYLMQPTSGESKWFEQMNKFGAYDHSFPKLIVASERQRVIGSSDAAFVAELTAANAHVPPCLPTDPAEPDRFMQNHAHHGVNRNVVCIWRAAN